MNYVLKLVTGQELVLQDLDLNTIQIDLDNNDVIVIDLGDMALQKGLIAYIVKETATDDSDKNMVINLAGESYYFKSDDIKVTVKRIATETNKQSYIRVNDEILFNRGYFQFTQEYIKLD